MTVTCTPARSKGLVHLWHGCGIGGIYKDSEDPVLTCNLCIELDSKRRLACWSRIARQGMLARYGDIIAGRQTMTRPPGNGDEMTTPARPIDDGQLPTSAARLVKKITDRWTAEATCSPGPAPDSDCIVIQLSDDTGTGAVATFLNGRFVGGFVWTWCTTCTGPGFGHPADVPAEIGYRELCRTVSEE